MISHYYKWSMHGQGSCVRQGGGWSIVFDSSHRDYVSAKVAGGPCVEED